VRPPGPLLAAGRDCDIFEYGPGLVLRRSREGHSMATEARTLEYVRGFGFPVPAVDEVSDDGTDIVLERLDGPSMVDFLSSRPWTIRRQGASLADLHRRLHEIPAPEWVGPAPTGDGDRLLHLDFHPLNVMITKRGPVVIDWPNARRGDPDVDVALTWILMSAGEVSAGRLIGAVLGQARKALVRSFLRTFDLDALRAHLPALVEWKCSDPHMSEAEQQAMRRLAGA
jgi:aminoglycoside phosphotransferase (APT) family kinase protein